ncbi:DNA-3-methyladenine glycosylase 1 [Telopea speciosissima]|uniref:DNA-3-methyladenine glycosylase 1 n=1 Tax=Telopea speciosissima TaxID=54955 RepID=UPI001CC3DE74|nr:DNA-3-methyladenine glycosylase 1 [Telopea speciosissima]
MSVVTESQPLNRTDSEVQSVLRPAGNSVRVSKSLESKQKNDVQKKPQQMRGPVSRSSESIHRRNFSVDSSCSSDSSRGLSSMKMSSFGRRMKPNGLKSVKVVPDGVEVPSLSTPVKLNRCDWITSNTDPIYISFHDEEWGVPVHDDRKLFEMLVLSEALAELSWPTILNKRDIFRKVFDNFDPTSVANFTEKKILALKATGSTLLSEPKLRAVVENARQMIKIQQEFGSFASYCWSFVNNKPIKNGFRYVRKVPVKTPKSEAMSKDLMRRGFRCVGPTVIYSFMQVSGIVNDHLITCFRYQECNSNIQTDFKTKIESTEVLAEDLEKTCLSHI